MSGILVMPISDLRNKGKVVSKSSMRLESLRVRLE